MKVKFNHYERVAGLFVLVAAGFALTATIGMGIKKGWFEPKITLRTVVPSADGIHAGTPVNFAGLRIGSVDTIDLINSNEVEIRFKIFKRFAKRVHTQCQVRVVRPFVIGEKALVIDSGDRLGAPVKDGQILVAEYAPDFLEFLGGNKLGSYMQSLDVTMGNLQKLAEAFLSNERSDRIIELFDELFPLMKKMNSMAGEVSMLSASLNEKRRMARALDDFLKVSQLLNTAMPDIAKDMPEMGKNLFELTKNMNQLSSDLKEIVPMVKDVAPEIPSATRKAVRALDETVITLKAMQKTWVLESNVKEVLEEEKKRQPASGK